MNHFRKATDVGTGGAKTLPSRYYTSTEIYSSECERLFAQRWVCVGREDAVAQPGDYVLREVAGESVVLLRDRVGQVRAFFNVCRHRGTRLCTEPSGAFTHTIQCPYHAWTYSLDGRLVGAPSMEGTPDFAKADYPLHAVSVARWEGFIFVNLSPNPESFEDAFAPLFGRFQRYRLETLQVHRTIEYDVLANWKLIFQNYSECYHCATVHPQLVKLSPADSGENDLTEGPFLGGYMTIPNAESLSTTGRACAMAVGDLTADDLNRVYYYSIFPNLLLSLHSDYVMAHVVRPLAPNRTHIECSWLFHPGAPHQSNFDPESGISFWDETNRQDWRMCELSQLGASSRVSSPGPYSPRESISAAWDREYLSAMDESDPTMQPQ